MIWLASALGLAGGILLSFEIGKALLPRMVLRSEDMSLSGRLALGGAVVALFPAFLLSFAVGAPLGGAWGLAGLAIGVALIFAVVLVGGALAGVLLAKLVLRYRQRRW
jgi:hypothetical protein